MGGPTNGHTGPEGATRHDFPDTQHTAVVIGAGIAGLAAAVGFQKVGIPVIVLERRDGLYTLGNALGMWPNAFRALDALGGGPEAFRAFRESFFLVKQVEMRGADNSLLKRFVYDDELGPGRASETRCIRRSTLLEHLAKQLAPGTIFFDCAVDTVDFTETGATLRLRSGQTLAAKLVVGAEGASSPLSKALGLKDTVYRGYAGIRGLAPTKTAIECGAMQPGTMRMIMGPAARMGVVQMETDETYWFVAFTAPKGKSVEGVEAIRQEALEAVKGWSFPAKALIESAPGEHLTRNRIYDRQIESGKAYGRGCVTLCGDAHHASTPNLGQGGCTALEDGVELTRILRTAIGGSVGGSGPAFKAASCETLAAALREYEVHRSKRVAPLIAKAAWAGWVGQSTLWPVVWFRNYFVRNRLTGDDFLSHVHYDPGTL